MIFNKFLEEQSYCNYLRFPEDIFGRPETSTRHDQLDNNRITDLYYICSVNKLPKCTLVTGLYKTFRNEKKDIKNVQPSILEDEY